MEKWHDVPLSTLTTMRLGGPARDVSAIDTVDELEEAVRECRAKGDPFFVMGGGSNIIARDQGFAGVILLNRIKGFDVVGRDAESMCIRIGAGEHWDGVVARTTEMNLSGIEALSAIPGTAGATPVQNVGAYGQEIAQTLIELEAIDTVAMQRVKLSHRACGFSYRNSIFKDPARRRHIITSVTLRLRHAGMKPPFYVGLQHYLEQNRQTDYSPAAIRQAVMAIRGMKLPDPKIVANCGSFFKNPIIPARQAEQLAERYPHMPRHEAADGYIKLSAGWLIEQAGLKGYAGYGFAVSPQNALVIIHEHGGSSALLEKFACEIIDKVNRRFGVKLEQEPEIL